jgi:hypothetical protein
MNTHHAVVSIRAIRAAASQRCHGTGASEHRAKAARIESSLVQDQAVDAPPREPLLMYAVATVDMQSVARLRGPMAQKPAGTPLCDFLSQKRARRLMSSHTTAGSL